MEKPDEHKEILRLLRENNELLKKLYKHNLIGFAIRVVIRDPAEACVRTEGSGEVADPHDRGGRGGLDGAGLAEMRNDYRKIPMSIAPCCVPVSDRAGGRSGSAFSPRRQSST